MIEDLTETCRIELTRFGFPKTITVHICSKCGNTPDLMSKVEKHALQGEYDTAVKKSSNIHTDNNVKKISRMMHNTSRCCGVLFARNEADYHWLLWCKWQDRLLIPQSRINGPPVDGIPNLRIEYGDNEKYVDDDFILMHYLLGFPDTRTGDVIRIFRDEEIRQSNLIP